MSRKISDMRNLGPVMETMLAEIDIFSEEDLRALGVMETWYRLRFVFGKRISLNALYAMEAALQEIDWRALDVKTKEHLKREAGKNPVPSKI